MAGQVSTLEIVRTSLIEVSEAELQHKARLARIAKIGGSPLNFINAMRGAGFTLFVSLSTQEPFPRVLREVCALYGPLAGACPRLVTRMNRLHTHLIRVALLWHRSLMSFLLLKLMFQKNIFIKLHRLLLPRSLPVHYSWQLLQCFFCFL